MSREAVVEAATEATDVVFDTIEAVPEVVKNNPVVLAGVAVVSASLGALAAVAVTRKILKTKYERLIYEEIQEAKAFYRRQYKTGEFSDPTTLAEGIEDEPDDELNRETEMLKESVKILKDKGYVSYDKVSKEDITDEPVVQAVKVEVKNVFAEHGDEDEPDEDYFDHDVELAKKSQGKPYIISEEVYLLNDEEHTQTTLTWYEGDEILVDEREQAVTNVVGVIGKDNMKFGYGTNDPNVVYIRNDRFKGDYEVVRSEEKYAEAVHGFTEPRGRRAKPSRFPRDAE